MWYVYILKCSDNTYYTGFTSNLENRMMAHQKGEVHYTSSRLPVIRVTFITFSEKNKAILFEQYLKSGSGRAFLHKRLI